MLSSLAHAFVGVIIVAGEDRIVNNNLPSCGAGLLTCRCGYQSIARDCAAQLQKRKALAMVNKLTF